MIHQYQLGGYNIVLDICSGSIHVVDEVAYDIISMFENNAKDVIVEEISKKYSDREDITSKDILDCFDQVVALKESGKLFRRCSSKAIT